MKNGGKFDQGYRWKLAGNLKTTKKPASQPASRPPVQTDRKETKQPSGQQVHQAGIEPATWGSTVPRSTTELLVVGDICREVH